MDRPNGIVTLTTDFGTRDAYVGAMKGALLRVFPEARLVDITHDIAACDVGEAADVLHEACEHFPDGTVHLAVVDPGVGTSRLPLVIETDRHVFVGPDNGLLSEVAAGGRAYAIDMKHAPAGVAPTFHGRDLFAPVAAMIASARLAPVDAGPPATPARLERRSPTVKGRSATGRVRRIDRFGNLVTDMHRNLFPPGAGLKASVRGKEVWGPVATYGDAPQGVACLLFGSSGYLEIAFPGEPAATRLGVGAGAAVEVSW